MRSVSRYALWATMHGLLLAAGDVTAQSVVAAGGYLERYGFRDAEAVDIESLTLYTVPLIVRFDVSRRLSIRMASAFARASLVRPDGSESSISGLTDTEATAQFEIGEGAIVLTASTLLPTGHRRLDGEEIFVAGAIGADLLPFRITNWGSGGGAGLAIAAARPIGSFAVGISAGYVVARAFRPLAADEFEYRPGNQAHARLAIDRTIGRASKAALQVGWQRFGADEGDGRNLFQPGDRVTAVGSFDFALGQSSAIAYAGWMNRGEGEFAEPTDLLPAQQLFYSGFGVRMPIGGSVLQPSVDLRVQDSDGADRHGYTLGIGGSLELPVGRSLVVPTLRARTGRIEASNGASRFAGGEVGLAIRFGG